MSATALGRVRSSAGRILREALLHARRFTPHSGAPRLVIFPCGRTSLPSSRLRAWELGRQLERAGWRVAVVHPSLTLAQRRRILRAERPDVILLQKQRHPLNRPGLYAPTPCVFDLDDADYLDPAEAGAVEECCRDAAAVVAGNEHVARVLRRWNPRTAVIWTGTPAPAEPPPPSERRAPVVAWGIGVALRYPREAALLLEAARLLAARRKFELWIYGLPAGRDADRFLAPFREAEIAVRSFEFMPYDDYVASLREAAVGVQILSTDNPYSEGKSFGKVLAYLAAGAAVVASDAADHARFFRHGENGLIATDAASFAKALDRLLGDAAFRARIVAAAWTDFQAQLTTEAMARQVDAFLKEVLATRSTR